jgi:3-oxoacyl-[acyl-carrier protein] reductase
MDLGLKGRWALVCAASKGLGRGCAEALVGEGVNVVITARGEADLLATAAALRVLNPAVEVRTVAGDIATEAGRAAALAACPQVDILVNNAGGPPPGGSASSGSPRWTPTCSRPSRSSGPRSMRWPRAVSAASSTSPRVR